MNTSKEAKVILCFGDSNTWGRNPNDRSRYDVSQRWTGVLQQNFGQDFYVIEEGLGGRTTDCENPIGDGRDGLTYFKPCVESHEPDIIVLMLGTNDLKDVINKTSDDIVASLEKYCDYTATLDKKPELILVAPTGLNMDVPKFMHPDKFSQASVQKSLELPSKIENLAKKHNCKYINASDIATIGDDGLHWTEESHEKFANLLAGLLNKKVEDEDITNKFVYSTDSKDMVNKFGVDIYSFTKNLNNISVVYEETKTGHMQEWYSTRSTYHWFIIEGSGYFVINGKKYPVKEKDLVVIPPNNNIYYVGNMRMLLFLNPAYQEQCEHQVRVVSEEEI